MRTISLVCVLALMCAISLAQESSSSSSSSSSSIVSSSSSPVVVESSSSSSSSPAVVTEPSSSSSSSPAVATESSSSSSPAVVTEPSSSSSSPAVVTEPSSSSSPAVVTEPSSSSSPAVVTEPSSSSSPAVVTEPSSSSSPAVVTEPSSSSSPAVVTEPSSSSSPAVVTEPSSSSSPAVVNEPSSSSSPAIVNEPSSSSSPAVVNEPSSSSSPAIVTASSSSPAVVVSSSSSSSPAPAPVTCSINVTVSADSIQDISSGIMLSAHSTHQCTSSNVECQYIWVSGEEDKGDIVYNPINEYGYVHSSTLFRTNSSVLEGKQKSRVEMWQLGLMVKCGESEAVAVVEFVAFNSTASFPMTINAVDYIENTQVAGVDTVEFSVTKDFNATGFEGLFTISYAFRVTGGLNDGKNISLTSPKSTLPGNGTFVATLHFASQWTLTESTHAVVLALPSVAQVNNKVTELTGATTVDSAQAANVTQNLINAIVAFGDLLDVTSQNKIADSLVLAANASSSLSEDSETLLDDVEKIAQTQEQAIEVTTSFTETKKAEIVAAAATAVTNMATKILGKMTSNTTVMVDIPASTATAIYNIAKNPSVTLTTAAANTILKTLSMAVRNIQPGAEVNYPLGTKGKVSNVGILTTGPKDVIFNIVTGSRATGDLTSTLTTAIAGYKYSFSFLGGSEVNILAISGSSIVTSGESVTVLTSTIPSGYNVSCSVNVTGSNGLPSATQQDCVVTAIGTNTITCKCQSFGQISSSLYLLASTPTSGDDSTSGLSGGGIAGIVIAVVVVVGAIIAFFVIRNQKKHKKVKDMSP